MGTFFLRYLTVILVLSSVLNARVSEFLCCNGDLGRF